MNTPTEEDILKAINESGYLFEQEIGFVIEKFGFNIQTNSAFKDSEEERSRELDVTGYKRFFYDEKNKISIGIRILCECKNNKNPFVFITRNKGKIDKNYSPPNFLYPAAEYMVPVDGQKNSFYRKDGFMYYNINEIFPYSIKDYKAVQFCKLVQKNKEWNAFHDGIYDSILMPLSKSLDYYKNKDIAIRSETWKNYIIYFPIVVLNSKIFSIDSHIDKSKVNEIGYISFTREIESKKQNNKYLIDFISKEFLEEYLESHVNDFAEKFKENILKKESDNKFL
ncbi:Uncharacterised protein [Chryseobacterium gleum]|uniref:Uncharacterized protein n=2 Tax=Chryseobacterium gleum TaxID=250 RepID=A0A3S4MQL1_CHRGE|nr:hypothetical protein [Chryseobacterium gleum]EFK36257.1 hypothetical protein HMPREF0204_11704 [Chryseobacterium gleum ATCC 35910]QQY33508.1 hypothetical protein I6I60_06960 [Chryseobacterium gleum]VEE08600.1 Uncharacterised protein [Chryseobacterium gleum]